MTDPAILQEMPAPRRIVIIGNSGSGKSTLARSIQREPQVALLDLDTIAWEKDPPPRRREQSAVEADLRRFCQSHDEWIAEGCYGDLAAFLLNWSPLLVFLNRGVEACQENCRKRPWEPHKYANKQAQDAGLEFLLGWVRDYETRDDDCSLRRHRTLFNEYAGPKKEIC